MNEKEQRKAAKQFAENWKDKGDEKGESQKFWLSLLRDVYGVEHPENYIEFEDRVFLGHTSFIDGYIPETKVLIEQKAIGKNLRAAIKQSDGTMLTPFQQAKRYVTELPVDQHPNFIITSNFESFLVYDMNNPQGEPEEIFLKDLERDYYRLSFLVKTNNVHLQQEMELSIKAGEIVGLIYDALLKQYKEPENADSLKSLNMLCVRIVFCLYAEDSELFNKNAFRDYLMRFEAKDVRRALIELFKVLDKEEDKRDPYLEDELAIFPYVNGGLFAEEDIEIPQFTDELKTLLVTKASDFNWSEISPTIFGAVFESTLNPETRRSGGMHYTSIENIHKVIDPLFLDSLKNELADIKELKTEKTRKDKIRAFQDKLSKLQFLDPACGSGNFLTETFISLRRLENEALEALYKGQITFGLDGINPIKVSISQFYGIEINDFAVTVGKTALWIAESQMMKETEDIVHMSLDFLPLKTNAYIHEGNALRLDWNEIVDKHDLNYIMGNPPFSAGRRMGDSQREDMNIIASDFPKNGELDYVSLWYIKAAAYMQNTRIKCGYVSTSSITQGEQVILLWKKLFEEYHLNFFYAIRSFNWQSEAKSQAGVHCVILLFTINDIVKEKFIVDNNRAKRADHINGYLVDANDMWIEGQKEPICNVPKISNGSKPLDNAICAFTPDEKADFLKKEPKSKPYFYRYMGSKEFINNIERWFLLINRIPLNELNKMPSVLGKLKEIEAYRLSSNSAQTKKLAETPAKFHFENMPEHDYLVIPQTSSGRRNYVPIGFLTPDVLCNNKLQIMRDGGIYEFGILSSAVHNAWLRAIGGRLREDFTYSVSIVYNTFPWCSPTPEQKDQIEKTAQAILDARNLPQYKNCSLADLYNNSLTMPPELRKAHQQNDIAVMKAYGFTKIGEDGKSHWLTESEVVAELMKMYQKITEEIK